MYCTESTEVSRQDSWCKQTQTSKQKGDRMSRYEGNIQNRHENGMSKHENGIMNRHENGMSRHEDGIMSRHAGDTVSQVFFIHGCSTPQKTACHHRTRGVLREVADRARRLRPRPPMQSLAFHPLSVRGGRAVVWLHVLQLAESGKVQGKQHLQRGSCELC